MEPERNQLDPTVRADGQSHLSLNESETGRFGVTKAELQGVIVGSLSNTRDGSKAARPLFGHLLKHMGIHARGKQKDELYMIFGATLRELKAQGKIQFISGKTRLYAKLTQP